MKTAQEVLRERQVIKAADDLAVWTKFKEKFRHDIERITGPIPEPFEVFEPDGVKMAWRWDTNLMFVTTPFFTIDALIQGEWVRFPRYVVVKHDDYSRYFPDRYEVTPDHILRIFDWFEDYLVSDHERRSLLLAKGILYDTPEVKFGHIEENQWQPLSRPSAPSKTFWQKFKTLFSRTKC